MSARVTNLDLVVTASPALHRGFQSFFTEWFSFRNWTALSKSLILWARCKAL